MKVIVYEPRELPYLKEIDGGLESLQSEVGGYIEAVYPFKQKIAIVCNEEGKISRLPPNRILRDFNGRIYDYIAGKFIVVGLGDESFTDVSEELIEKLMNDPWFDDIFSRGKHYEAQRLL